MKKTLVISLLLAIPLCFLLYSGVSSNISSYFGILRKKSFPLPEVKKEEYPEVFSAQIQGGIHVPILLYHYVEPSGAAPGRGGLTVTPENFDAQMGWLKANGFETTTLDILASHFASGTPLPAKPVILTFDDGYSNFYWHAFPILKKYGYQAHVFIITGKVGWPGYLDWDKIRELNGSGLVHFGSHGVDHVSLTSLSGNGLNFQVTESKKVLEQYLGKPIVWFCYPFGSFNASAITALRNAGYQGAVTAWGGSYQSIDILYALRRSKVGNLPQLPL